MQVEAIAVGYYDNRRWKPGQKFSLKEPKHFSKKWMTSLEVEAPETAKKGGRKPKAEAET